LKIQVNNLIKEKEQILLKANEDKKNYEDQLEQKKQEISSLSILNAKLKKNLEKVSNQVNKLLDKVVENKSLTKSGSSNNITTRNIILESKNNNKKRKITSALTKYKLNDNLTRNKTNEIYSNEEDKNKQNEIESLREQLVIKNSQLKNSLNLIEFLSKDNKKLKLQYDSFGSDINNINNYKLIEELKKKNKEILQLEKEYKEVALLKTSDKELDYYKSQVIQLKEINSLNESKIKKMKSVIERYQDLNKNNIINIKYKFNNSNDTKNCQRKINDLSNKDRKSLSMINSYDWRNPEINKNFNKLFNDNEKRALLTLFENEEDFQKFNQKLNTIEKHYSASEKRLQSNIKELKQSIADKDEQISYLRDKIRENEMKIKILLNQVHLERQKTTKK
jgi:kinetochore protein NDC80